MANTTANTTVVAGMTVVDLVTGVPFEVTAADDKLVKLTEIVPENEDKDPKTLELSTETAAKVLKINYDPRTEAIPTGYSVADGVLLKDGEPATAQGQLEFVEILTVMAGEVILTAKTKDKEDGKVEVFAYRPLKDEFKKLTYGVSSVRVIKEMSTDKLLVTELQVIEDRIAMDENGKDIFDKDGNKIILKDTVVELMVHESGAKAEFTTLNGTVDKVILVDGADNTFAVESDSILVYDEYGCGTKALKAQDRAEITMMAVASEDLDELWGDIVTKQITVTLPNGITAATVCASTGDYILRTENTLYVQNLGHNPRMITNVTLKNLDGYKYLVRADIRNGSEEYVLADKDYNVATVRKTKTYDRGDIITVEK